MNGNIFYILGQFPLSRLSRSNLNYNQHFNVNVYRPPSSITYRLAHRDRQLFMLTIASSQR